MTEPANPAPAATSSSRDQPQAPALIRHAPLQSVLHFAGAGHVDCGLQAVHAIARDLTIEAWIRVDAQREYAGILSKVLDTGAVESGYGLLLDGKSGVYFALALAGQPMQYVSSGPDTITLGSWHHVALSYDGQVMGIRIDGRLEVSSERVADAIDHEPANALRIGEYRDDNESYGFTGEIAELRLWARRRSAAELAADRYRRLRGDEPGLVGYWPLDDGAGSRTRDASRCRNPGTITDAIWRHATIPLTPADMITLAEDRRPALPGMPQGSRDYQALALGHDPQAGRLTIENTGNRPVALAALALQIRQRYHCKPGQTLASDQALTLHDIGGNFRVTPDPTRFATLAELHFELDSEYGAIDIRDDVVREPKSDPEP